MVTGAMSREWRGYLVAVAATALAVLLRWVFWDVLQGTLFLTFYPAVVVAAVLGGFWPGVLATLGALLSVDLLFDGTPWSIDIGNPMVLGRWCFFLAGGIGVSFACGALRATRARERRQSTQLGQAVVEAERQRETLAVTLASIGDAVIVTDVQGRVTFLNAEARRLTGWANEEATGQPLADVFRIIDEDRREPVESPSEKVLRSGQVVGLANHTLLVARDGRVTPIDDSGAPIRHRDGTVEGVVLVFRDCSERRAAEAALRASEQSVRRKLDCLLAPEGDIGELALEDIIDVPAIQSLMDDWYKLTGLAMAILDLQGKVLVGVGWQPICTKFHRVHPQMSQHCTESDLQLSAGVAPGEFKLYKCKNNMWDMATPVMVGGRHVGNLYIGQFFFEDEMPDREVFRQQARQCGLDEEQYLAALDAVPHLSRERVNTGMSYLTKLAGMISLLSYSNIKLARSSELLRRNETLLQAFMDGTPDPVFMKDLEGRLLLVNPAALRLFGWTLEEMLGQTNNAYFDDPALARAARENDELAMRDGCACTVEEVVHTPEGDRVFLTVKAPYRDADGRIQGVIGVAHDISERKQAEEALLRLSNRQEAILAAVPDIIAEVDTNKVYTWLNAAGRAFFGADAIGREASYYFEGGQSVYEMVAPLFAGNEEVIYVESWQRRQDGQKRLLAWWCRVLKDAQGRPAGALSTARDITEQKRSEDSLRESEELRRAITDNSTDAIYVKDRQSRWLLANPALLKIVGKSHEEVFGKTDAEIYAEAAIGTAILANDARIMESGVPEAFEERAETPDGVRVFLSTKSPRRDAQGQVIGLVGISRDITERKRIEEERERLLADLARSNAELEQFASLIAHDLLTPVVTASSYASLMTADGGNVLSARSKEALGQVREDLARMNQLIRRLLDYSRLGQGTLKREDCELEKVLDAVLKGLEPRLEQAGARVTRDALPKVQADATLLGQVFQNLLENALKYHRARTKTGAESAGEGAGPRIHVGAKEVDGAWVFSVSDDGIGIDSSHFERIFQMFQRLHRDEARYPGLGVGLAMCKRIIEKHGGRIWVESQVGQGSTFRFTLPR